MTPPYALFVSGFFDGVTSTAPSISVKCEERPRDGAQLRQTSQRRDRPAGVSEEAEDHEEEVLRPHIGVPREVGQAGILRLGEEVEVRLPAQERDLAQVVLQHNSTIGHEAQTRDRTVHEGRMFVRRFGERRRFGRVASSSSVVASRRQRGRRPASRST